MKGPVLVQNPRDHCTLPGLRNAMTVSQPVLPTWPVQQQQCALPGAQQVRKTLRMSQQVPGWQAQQQQCVPTPFIPVRSSSPQMPPRSVTPLPTRTSRQHVRRTVSPQPQYIGQARPPTVEKAFKLEIGKLIPPASVQPKTLTTQSQGDTARRSSKLSLKLCEEEDDCLRATFDFFDADGSGTISLEEFQQALNKMGQKSSMEEVEAIMATMSLNSPSEITYQEFQQIICSENTQKANRAQLKRYFATFDSDGSGYITAAEVRKMMTGLGQSLSDHEIDELMNLCDLDGSGQLTMTEFEAMFVGLGFSILEDRDEDSLYNLQSTPPQDVSKEEVEDELVEVEDEPVPLSNIDFQTVLKPIMNHEGKVRVSDLQKALELLQTTKTTKSLGGTNPENNHALHWDTSREIRGLGGVIQQANHIAITVSDVGKSAAFYSDVLGFQQIRRPDFDRHGAWFTMGNIELHLIKGVPVVPSGDDLIVGHISIETNNIDRVPGILKEMNIPFRQNVSVPKGTMAQGSGTNDANDSDLIVEQYFVTDPDGYYIEICNCDVLTKYCFGEKSELAGYSESVGHLNVEDAFVCANIGLKLAKAGIKRSKEVGELIKRKRKSLQGAPPHDIAKFLGCERADIVDEDRLGHFLRRHTIFGDICQNETPETLREILRAAGNNTARAVQLIQIRAGGEQIYRPPAFFDEGETKFVPKAFTIKT